MGLLLDVEFEPNSMAIQGRPGVRLTLGDTTVHFDEQTALTLAEVIAGMVREGRPVVRHLPSGESVDTARPYMRMIRVRTAELYARPDKQASDMDATIVRLSFSDHITSGMTLADMRILVKELNSFIVAATYHGDIVHRVVKFAGNGNDADMPQFKVINK